MSRSSIASRSRLKTRFTWALALGAVIWLPGCALLGLDRSADSDLDLNDPVVRAALEIRSGGNGIDRLPASSASAIRTSRQNRDVVPGMSMRDVRAVLGEPLEVETAGDESNGNERWVYSDGYRGELNHGPSRIVYFEGGKVAGWKNYDSR